MDSQALSIESSSGLIDRARLSGINAAADVAQMAVQPVFTYLANTMRANGREVPYSLVTATDLKVVAPGVSATMSDGKPSIVINEWAARELDAKANRLARHLRKGYVASRQRAHARVLDLLVAPENREPRAMAGEELLGTTRHRVDIEQRAEDVE